MKRIVRALVTAVCYHQMLFWGLWTFLSGVAVRALTFFTDARRRLPQWFAILFWGKLFWGTHPFWRLRVEGREHARAGGPYLVICNHQSLVDSLAMLMIDRQVKFISHEKVFSAPLLGPYMRLCGYIAVDPRNPFPAPRVAREIGHWWELGESVCLYPEGTRSVDGEIQPFKVGGFRLARKHGVAVLPVAIDGTHEVLPKGALSYRGRAFKRIQVRVLPPIHPADVGNDPIALARATHDAIASALDELRGRVTADDPPSYSGSDDELPDTRAATA